VDQFAYLADVLTEMSTFCSIHPNPTPNLPEKCGSFLNNSNLCQSFTSTDLQKAAAECIIKY